MDEALAISSFFVLCQEAFHHFAWPRNALYEVPRVARVGVVSIETTNQPGPLDSVKSLIKRILRGNTDQQFEPQGNFIYRPSLAGLRKLMLAMRGECNASHGIDDFHHRRLVGHDFAPRRWPTMAAQLGIALQNTLCATRLLAYGLGCIVIFKGAGPSAVRRALSTAGFRVDVLPRNPYLAAP